MQLKTWLVVGVVLTAVAVVGSVIALTTQTAPPGPRTLPIPAGTVIRITNIANVNGTIVNASIATFTVAPPGGRLVGAAYMVTGGALMIYPWPYYPVINCPFNVAPGLVIFNDTLDPGTYGIWIMCKTGGFPTPANPIIINVTQTIEMVYG